MYALSKFSFVSNFNKEKLTKMEAYNNGLSSFDIKKCDKDNNGEITVNEVLNDTNACAKLLAKINSIANEQANVIKAIKEARGEKVDAEKDTKAAEKNPKHANGDNDHFKNFLKQPPRFGDYNTFNVAA